MLEFGALGEFLIIAIAALVLIGPKEMPQVLRFLGRMTFQIRRRSAGWRSQLSQYMHEGEADEYDRQVKKNLKDIMPDTPKGEGHD